MIRKLQFLKTAVLSVFLLGGANLAWGDGKTIYPSTEMSCRIISDGSGSYKYKDNATKLATITAETQESTYRKSGFFILEEFDFSKVDINRIKSITITYTTKESQVARIWIFGSTLPGTSVTAASLAETMNTVMGAYPNQDAASTIEGKSLANGGARTTVTTNVVQQDVTISGDKLTTFKNSISDNKIVLVSSTSVNANLNYYTFKSESYKPKMVIEYYPVTVTIGGTTTNYAEINSTLKTSLTDDAVIKIYDDVNMSDRIQVAANKTVSVEPQKDGITITNKASNSLSFLAGNSSSRLNVGNETFHMTITNSTASTNAVVESSNASSIVDIKNVTFSSISTSNEWGIIRANNGKVYLKNVTFDNCTSNYSGDVKCTVKCGNDDGVVLEGNNQFTDCTVYDIYAAKRFRISDNGVIHTTPIKIYSKIALSAPVATNVAQDEVALFDLQDTEKGLRWRTDNISGTRRDMEVTEAYTLSVNSYGAATLVLPFASTIPTGVSAYKLSYSGGDKVTATEVETTLPANTPVLVNAAEGPHKFVSTTTVSEATTGSGTPTDGALVGTYIDDTSAEGYYVLFADETHKIGFYKAGSGVTIDAYRAYLKASAGSRMFIGFDDETTGIDSVVKQDTKTADNVYYNLSGQRVANPSKGLYIVNGKKVIIK